MLPIVSRIRTLIQLAENGAHAAGVELRGWFTLTDLGRQTEKEIENNGRVSCPNITITYLSLTSLIIPRPATAHGEECQDKKITPR